jgi:hypothetical protein
LGEKTKDLAWTNKKMGNILGEPCYEPWQGCGIWDTAFAYPSTPGWICFPFANGMVPHYKPIMRRLFVVKEHLDLGSIIVILITLVLFIAALFVKGLTHDLLLEAGVFLVSVKVIMMAYANSVHANEILREIRELKDATGAN